MSDIDKTIENVRRFKKMRAEWCKTSDAIAIIAELEKEREKYKAMFDVSAAQEAELETAQKRIKHLENELESANKDAGF